MPSIFDNVDRFANFDFEALKNDKLFETMDKVANINFADYQVNGVNASPPLAVTLSTKTR